MSFYQFARHVCTAFLYIAFNYKVEGLENLPKDGGFVLCSNHRSYLDPVFLALRVKRQLNFMAKEELFRVKVLGPIIKKPVSYTHLSNAWWITAQIMNPKSPS